MKKKVKTKYKLKTKKTGAQKAYAFAAQFGVEFDESNYKSVQEQRKGVAGGKYKEQMWSGKEAAIAFMTSLTPDEYKRELRAAKQWNPTITEDEFLSNFMTYEDQIQSTMQNLIAANAGLSQTQLSRLIATQIYGSE